MPGVARLDHRLDLRELHRHVVKQAVMVDLDDVAALLADDAGDLREGAGNVGDLDPEPHQPAGARQAALQDRGDQPCVNVAAREHGAPATPPEALAAAPQPAQGPATAPTA